MSSRQPASSNLVFLGATAAAALAVSLFVWRKATKRPSPCHRDEDGHTGHTHGSDDDDDHSIPESLRRDMEKERRRQAKIPMLSMKSPMYDNIMMLDPSGTLLCTISKKKARWYVKKNLGTWKDEEETTVQLLFEPSHRSNESKPRTADKIELDGHNDSNVDGEEEAFFNKSIKENICVVCGDDEYHQRHYIVPYACRSLFPNKYKMHMAHDVVILCPDCHLDCKKMATKRMKFMERQCRVDPNTAIPHFVDGKLHKIKSCALALLRWRHKLPPSAIKEYEGLIRTHFNIPEAEKITTTHVNEATEIEASMANPHFIPTSDVVVASLCQDDASIETFVKGWRKHFVETMDPQHLPKGWSVNSAVACSSADRKSN